MKQAMVIQGRKITDVEIGLIRDLMAHPGGLAGQVRSSRARNGNIRGPFPIQRYLLPGRELDAPGRNAGADPQ